MENSESPKFWFKYRQRTPSTGWISSTVNEMRFDTAEERDARAKLGDVSVFEKGEDR